MKHCGGSENKLKAVILAGGFGTRLRPLTFTHPKPVLPLLNKPILHHIIEYLSHYGVDEAIITTNYLRQKVIDHLGESYFGVKLSYPVEETPLGTAGSVKNIQDRLGDTFLVMQGDTICDINLSRIKRAHKNHSAQATIATYEVDDPWHFGVVDSGENGLIKGFQEKPAKGQCTCNQVNTGIYVFEPEVLDLVPPETPYDFSRDLFPRLLRRQAIYSVSFGKNSFWVDVGQPYGYRKASRWLMDKASSEIHQTALLSSESPHPLVVGENTVVNRGVEFKGPAVLGDNVVVDADCVLGAYTVVGSNSNLGSSSCLDGAILFDDNQLGSSTQLLDCVISNKCRIAEKTSVREDSLLGAQCNLDSHVHVARGSRIWPRTWISSESIISGTLRKYYSNHEHEPDFGNPKTCLRQLSLEEAFYFNKKQGRHVSFTGFRARSLMDFIEILKQVDPSSLQYHFRGEFNDFSSWIYEVLCDDYLSLEFHEIKQRFQQGEVSNRNLRKTLLASTVQRFKQLEDKLNPKGYL
ncbi:MAG: NTP transferase domain-containing protein [Candidatus Altiarchaeales archaeon]|nr:NTP transferase domain-containing protein [Candidatus Altiarchaeales archaeon]